MYGERTGIVLVSHVESESPTPILSSRCRRRFNLELELTIDLLEILLDAYILPAFWAERAGRPHQTFVFYCAHTLSLGPRHTQRHTR